MACLASNSLSRNLLLVNKAETEDPFDNFGAAVKLSQDGNRLAVGSPGAVGKFRVFEVINNEWSPMTDSVLSQIPGEQFGYSLDLNKDATIIAVHSTQDGGEDAGKVQVFSFDGSMWSQMGR